MFEKPRNGWTDILIGDFEGLGSYIQDIPAECMQAFTEGLRNNTPVRLHFDEEGSEFTLTAAEEIKIVAQGYYGPETYEVKMTKAELIAEICEDMEEYFEDWVAFSEDYAYFEDDEIDEKEAFFEERSILLQSLLDELKALI